MNLSVTSLHSNLVLFKLCIRVQYLEFRMLYIPIWFYSNTHIHVIVNYQGYFTFQSGSIQMIFVVGGIGDKKTPLHSNLVLFK